LHVHVYRISGGRIAGNFRGARVLLLTTIGRKTGKRRTTPLFHIEDGQNKAVVASNGGRDKDPSWWANLKTNPEAEIQIGAEAKKVRARKASAEEKKRLWPLFTKVYPTYDDYQRKTNREIPVAILEPIPLKVG
jgi:deazaflavin-dependent oxidoreductase (nitroreductase family)